MDLFKELGWNAFAIIATSRLIIRYPWLGWGPQGWIAAWLIRRYAGELHTAAKEQLDLKQIQFKNEAAGKMFTLSSVRLKIIGEEKGVASKEFQDERARCIQDMHRMLGAVEPELQDGGDDSKPGSVHSDGDARDGVSLRRP
jgi:hypothetical protein